ncbi:MAG: CBS domain protein AcuB [Hydrogenibacillus schlegelii]|uniref:CBS domain protein AcuB n=1 Tax=Hydrogenibacillus schlegelii TaxID=1484 RepID=A0A2T5GBL0_HYDSH|nr:CBS and ACT domain-containing protein [Hydrogenibacillus schlegelii]PTQ53583.1 MAG: CBS domain protein AcuB [Hydrogenibacillus schlegelii]
MLVADIMHTPVITASRTATIREALELLHRHRIRHLPIVDGEGRLFGIVTDRDLREAVPSRLAVDEALLARLAEPVETIVRREVITTHPGEFVEEAAQLMRQHKIGCLPVIADDAIVGIVTHSDLLSALITLLGVDAPSTRLEVEVPDRVGMIADLTAIFKQQGINIVSLFVYQSPEPGWRRAAIRARTMDPRRLIAAIRAAGFVVRWPKLPDDRPEGGKGPA